MVPKPGASRDISEPSVIGMTLALLPVSLAFSECSIEIAYLANNPPKECAMKEIFLKPAIFLTTSKTCFQMA
jgi:hypothetical protein